jgi:probable rRNA maturation factor
MKRSTHAPKVEVRNLQRKLAVKVVDLQEFAQKAAKLCLRLPKKNNTDLAILSNVSILIVSDRRMSSLHRRFMNESGPTDVITFQHGEIFISADTALRNARRFENPLNRELRLYIVHGLLHLHGFDDRDPASAGKMRAAEKKILSTLRRFELKAACDSIFS